MIFMYVGENLEELCWLAFCGVDFADPNLIGDNEV